MFLVLLVLLVVPNVFAVNIVRDSIDNYNHINKYENTHLRRSTREACGPGKWQCRNGQCIDSRKYCNNLLDCEDESDEKMCDTNKPLYICRDGTNVTTDKQCDGVKDCPDGSDEAHAICRNIICPDYLFRCTYGACIDGTALCNGVQDCADNSDELHHKCRNESDTVGYKFKCGDGELINVYYACDGEVHCADGSDETLRACAGATCSTNLFQCAYGACVDEAADCNDEKAQKVPDTY
ncbi:low-density lipoprotein receptor-like [Leptidea sinapis]|uniref:low-density lipoprotein receptor-like n=1 Tax=Leptidea sinapis TaxID=189913 RepID=UPI0021C45593|nr:low-density lipoprotein receptor-like [Leptidea sinapis]